MIDTAMELMFQEQMRKNSPGMPEQDIINLSRSAATLEIYQLGPDSLEREGVPKGTLIDGNLMSHIYSESNHPYKIYVPVGYEPDKAYPFIIFLDGITHYLSAIVNANVVLDNLIADGRIPAMLAIFLEPGDHGVGTPIYGGTFGLPRSNRSTEYDPPNDVFISFLLEELLPAISKDYHLTDDPALRCICGGSCAAHAAFNAAWHRPDAFGKVISHVGAYVNYRGGDCCPDRIRKSPPKPLRIFLQTGEQDANIIFGDFKLSNLTMASALEYRGYDYKLVVGEGGHSYEHAGAILPETLEWIWR